MKRWIWSLSLLPMAAVASGDEGRDAVARRVVPAAAKTIYVPIVNGPGLDRAERLRLTEVLIKQIEQTTRYKVVGSPEGADLVFEGTVRVQDKPAR